MVLTQGIANTLGNFDIQGFRLAAVTWLVENNHPLREFETPAFRRMLAFANPEAEDALWESRTSVSRYEMRLYDHLLPQVVDELSHAASLIHLSFDGWTTKGGGRSFFSVVAHYADNNGEVVDLPIALPQLSGSHTGKRIGEIVVKTLQKFGISSSNVGYFVLDNANANDKAVEHIANKYDFKQTIVASAVRLTSLTSWDRLYCLARTARRTPTIART